MNQAEHLLASSTKLPELVQEFLLNQAGTKEEFILDLGAGNGRFLKKATQHLPSARIIGLEADPHLLANIPSKLYTLLADALHLPFTNNALDMAIAINSGHEICAAPSEIERLDRFKLLTTGIGKVLKPGGKFILFDGIMPADEKHQVHLKPKTEVADKTLGCFMESYTGMQITAEPLKQGGYLLTLADLICFLTKYPYIYTDYWENERRQLYPFLSLNRIRWVLEEQFNTITITHPQSRTGLRRFLDNYDLDEYSFSTFPPVQVLIVATKPS